MVPYICFGHYVTIIRGIYIQDIHKRMVRCGGYLCVNRTILLCMPCIYLYRLNNHKIKQQKLTARSEVHIYMYIYTDTPDDGHVVTETYVGYH
jgi:hypothetical protein